MALEALLRLAWQADRDGRANRRDALLTLAVAEAPADAPWLGRCRRRLVQSRPDHPFAAFPNVAAALADPRVERALKKLRAAYFPGRARSLLALDAIRRGPFTGREPSLAVLLADLFPTRESHAPVRPSARSVASLATVPSGSPLRFYFEVLLAAALLLRMVLAESEPGSRAA